MKRLIVILFIVLCIIMASATFIGQSHDFSYVSSKIYGTWWFAVLWGTVALLGILYVVKHIRKRPVLWSLHISLLLILLGALLTELTAKHGTLNLARGDDMVMFSTNNSYYDMPIKIRLDSFEVKYYPKSRMPYDYISHVTVTDKADGHSFRQDISMNKILCYKNYRYYQMSYNPEDNSSVLVVNYDPYGITISYLGYYLLFISFIWMLFDKHCGFRIILSSLSDKQRKSLLISLLTIVVIAIVGVIFMVRSKVYLMPVLRSRLLYVHVSALVISYFLMGVIFVVANISLIRHFCHKEIRTLTRYSRLLLYPSLALMGIGIFLGAIWANISWGNYWSWDPKETWALIAFLVYSAGVHSRVLKSLSNDVFYNTYMIFTFIILLMTYLGVNYYLNGMHSYA